MDGRETGIYDPEAYLSNLSKRGKYIVKLDDYFMDSFEYMINTYPDRDFEAFEIFRSFIMFKSYLAPTSNICFELDLTASNIKRLY